MDKQVHVISLQTVFNISENFFHKHDIVSIFTVRQEKNINQNDP